MQGKGNIACSESASVALGHPIICPQGGLDKYEMRSLHHYLEELLEALTKHKTQNTKHTKHKTQVTLKRGAYHSSSSSVLRDMHLSERL